MTHPWDERYIYLHEWLMFMVNVPIPPIETNGWNLKSPRNEKENYLNQTFILRYSMLVFGGVPFKKVGKELKKYSYLLLPGCQPTKLYHPRAVFPKKNKRRRP